MQTQNPIDVIKEQVNMLLSLDKVDEALTIMKSKIATISDNLQTSIILNTGNFTALKNQKSNGLISSGDYAIAKGKIKKNLIAIMGRVDTEIKVKTIMGELDSVYTTNYTATLEKIQGPNNNLQPINWLQKAIQASKSVCQVELADGGKGTGWLLEGGWLMTNHHVISKKEKAKTAIIRFDFEEDVFGKDRKTSEFRLDEETAIFSSLFELDYAYLKVIDNPDNPLSQWGHLKVNELQEPQVGQLVNIIQHPSGERKQIALTENNIVGVENKKLFYKTDTERGSSGSPVFNDKWEVIALHHAGKTEEEGGVNLNGERVGANVGVLIKYIMEDIRKKKNN